MECKYTANNCIVHGKIELIDTLWNVNAKKLGQIAGGVFRINRYIMECKLHFAAISWARHNRINRYIMECKFVFEVCTPHCVSRINRYIMECKCDCRPFDREEIVELIDTLWNVNIFSRIHCFYGFHELIDTLWNVNLQAVSYLQLCSWN